MWKMFKHWRSWHSFTPLVFVPQQLEHQGQLVDIRQATLQDAQLLDSIQKQVYAIPPWQLATFYLELANRRRLYLLAQTPTHVIGFIGCDFFERAHITYLAILPHDQHQGWGHLLLQVMIDYCQNFDYPELTLEVDYNNQAAQKLYLQLGFQPIKLLKNYYPMIHHDAIFMSRPLTKE